jgi:protein-S-isoprenylcysteine O-methyltransferase Ste14
MGTDDQTAVRLLRGALVMALIATIVLGLSGQWSDPWLLAYLAIWTGLIAYGLAAMGDDLARERFSPPDQGADRAHLRFIRLTAVAHLAIGALDTGRWHLAPVADPLRALGLVGIAVFGGLVFRSMAANRFFSAVVRIQKDRGHSVIDQGPYAVIRHPGYAGMILSVPCSGLALGSWLSVGLALMYSALMLRRVAFEDAFLGANLQGYAEYRTRVRYRLVPGLW